MLFGFKVTVDLEGTILLQKGFFSVSSQITDYYFYLHFSPPPSPSPPKILDLKNLKSRRVVHKTSTACCIMKESTAFDTLRFQWLTFLSN